MMKRYSPDFPLMMRLCETNYAQLRRLLPRKDEVGESQGYQVNGACYLIKLSNRRAIHQWLKLLRRSQHRALGAYLR